LLPWSLPAPLFALSGAGSARPAVAHLCSPQAIIFILALKAVVYAERCALLLARMSREGATNPVQELYARVPRHARPRGLHALPSTGLPPLDVDDVPVESLVAMARLVLPAYALLAPVLLSLLYASIRSSWRAWFLQHGKTCIKATLLMEFAVMGFYTDGVIWLVLRRVTLWPAVTIVISSACEIFAHPFAQQDMVAYGVAIVLKWLTLNVAALVLPFHTHTHWPAMVAAMSSTALGVNTPLRYYLRRRRERRLQAKAE